MEEVIVLVGDKAVEWRIVEDAEKMRRISRGTKLKARRTHPLSSGVPRKRLQVEIIKARRPSLWQVTQSVAFVRMKVIGLHGGQPEVRT